MTFKITIYKCIIKCILVYLYMPNDYLFQTIQYVCIIIYIYIYIYIYI